MSGLLLAAALAAADPQAAAEAAAAFEAANVRYLAGDHEGAARGYEQLVEAGWTSPALFYNLGNAYFRSGRTGWAVLSYERALRLAPGDADARANLELAQAGGVDRLVGAQDEPLLDRVVERLPSAGAAAAFAAGWLGLWALLLVRRSAFGLARTLLGAGALAAATLATGAGSLLSLKARAERVLEAVVVARVTPVREAPAPALKPAFELHEGTKVRILQASGEFVRVRLPNGLEGWVSRAEVGII